MIWFKIWIQTDSNKFQILPNFDRSKKNVPKLKKFEVKYGCEGFEEWNKFIHRNLFRFEMGFELKFREVKVSFWF
jgi:hypothetical protein